MLNGNPVWPVLVVVMMVLNTVLGEELLFRGLRRRACRVPSAGRGRCRDRRL